MTISFETCELVYSSPAVYPCLGLQSPVCTWAASCKSEMPLFDHRSGPSYGAIENNDKYCKMDEERDQLLGDGREFEDGSASLDATEEAQEGVLKIEAINMTWTTRSLIIAYVR